ncbi:MAG: hypothetical protein EXS17_00670 [Phycisphaerales bacterium]|nr:hypothetical protein [Phycisphaerales bacterium]
MTTPSWIRTIGWGLFCSASWTWCIGMFLPFILLNQFGWPGFLAFFIPNVLGCALFGYVLNPARAQFVRTRCADLCLWFSLATLLYQAFFAGWMLPPLGAIAVIMGGLAAARFLGDSGWLRFAVIVTIVSALAIDWDGLPSLLELSATGTRPPQSLPALVPAIAVGFLACPYLDLTFHRALDRSPSRHAFLVFGVVFALTLLCVATFFDRTTMSPRLGNALMMLWAVQLFFTIGAHAREGCTDARPLSRRLLVVWVLLVGLALGWLTRLAPAPWWGSGEETYLRLLVLYGLVFPYFLLLRLRAVPVWLSVGLIIASLPFFELGFMQNRTGALFIPLALLLVLLMSSLVNRRWKDRLPT